MIEMFIAVLIVMLIMTGFLFAIIVKCVNRLNETVKVSFLKNLEVYDEQIEEKSGQLRELKRKISEMETEPDEQPSGVVPMEPVTAAPVIENRASYVDEHFKDHYTMIKNNFAEAAYAAMYAKVNELVRDRKDINVHEFKEILELFTYDLQYEMLSLNSEEQLAVMTTVVQNSVGKKRILKKYVERHDPFEFKEFIAFVRDYIFRNDTLIYVYSNTGEQAIEGTPKHVLYEKDPSIVEGYKVKYKDRIYDYSL